MTLTNNYETFIEELYTKIINSQNYEKTFQENLELWKSFYQDRDSIIKEQLLNEKLFTVIKFLLSQEHGEIFDYFHSNLMDTLNWHQSSLCFHLRNQQNKEKENIDKLFMNLKYHDELMEYIEKNKIEDSLGSMRRHPLNELKIDTLNALIINVHSNFFELPPELVKKTIEFVIKNTVQLEKNHPIKILMHIDLLSQYQEKLLPLKVFLGEKIKNDLLIVNIKNGTIQYKKILKKLFEKVNVEELLSIFNDSIIELINFLKQINYLDEVEKQVLFNNAADKLLNDKLFLYLLPLLTERHENALVKNYMTKENIEKLINIAKTSSPINLEEEKLNYLLDNEYIDITFITNMIHMLNFEKKINENDKKIYRLKINKILKKYGYKTVEEYENVNIEKTDSIETKIEKIQKYEFAGKIMDFNTSIEILRKYLQNQIELDKYSIRQIVKSIGIQMLKAMEVPINGIYFVNSNRCYGTYYPDNESIALNNLLISKLQEKEDSLYDRLKIFITLFHEIRHAKIQNSIKHQVYDIETYEMAKENILMEYDSSFYETNYWNINHEMDARIAGFDMLAKFIETYLPEFLDKVQDEIIADLEKEQREKQQQNNLSKVEVLKNIEINFYKAFDTLVRYNPSILEKEPIFLLEYRKDGTQKTYEEILSSKNETNQPLIEYILKKKLDSSSSKIPQELSTSRKSK